MLNQNYEADALYPLLQAAGIDKSVVVQATDSYEDTAYMLKVSDTHSWIGAVIGWVNLLDPDETRRRLTMYTAHPKFRGVRHLIHGNPDPDWILQPIVAESLRVLAEYDVIFEVPYAYPRHLKQVPYLCEQAPTLRIIIDYLAKPPIKAKQFARWNAQFKIAAAYPNTYAKISGLNTADWEQWSADDLKPYVDFAFECFGADRLMFGSDWPVCLLAGDYGRVWHETLKALSGRTAGEIDAVLGGTAQKVYDIA